LLCEPHHAERVRHAAPKNRAAYWGTRSQLHRSVGQYDDAVDAGERALQEAETGLLRAMGILGNFLIHARLARARFSPSNRAQDLDAVRGLLTKSRTEWLPKYSANARASHLKFCEHHAAEIARLSGEPFSPTAAPHLLGTWDHPVLFTLLSASRNRANEMGRRRAFAAELRQSSEHLAVALGPLFSIFHAVYDVYGAALDGVSPTQALSRLSRTLGRFEADGLPGWRTHLTPYMAKFAGDASGNALDCAETLCDAIPYH